MKKMLALVATVILCLCAALPANADNRADLAAACADANKECPAELSEGMTLKSIKLVDENVVFSYVMAVDKNTLQVFKAMEDDFMQSLLTSMKGDENMTKLCELCKAAKCNLMMRFSNRQGDYIDMTLPYEKM